MPNIPAHSSNFINATIITLIIVIYSWMPVSAFTKDNTLSSIAMSTYFMDYMAEDDIEYAIRNGVDVECLNAIKANNGFIDPENGYIISRWLVRELKENRMESADEYRLALIWDCTANERIFNYERHDSTYNELRKNIELYASDEDNRTAWRLILEITKLIHDTRRIDWHIQCCMNQINFYLKKKHKISPIARLVLLLLKENGFLNSHISMSEKEINSLFSEINELDMSIFPHIPEIHEYHKIVNLLTKINLDISSSESERAQLKEQLNNNTVSHYDVSTIMIILGYNLISAQLEAEGREYISEAIRFMERLMEKQARITVINSNYISHRLFINEYNIINSDSIITKPASEKDIVSLLIKDIDSSIEGNRCKTAGLASYIHDRTGIDNTLSTSEFANLYLSQVSSDPYIRYRIEGICNSAEWLFWDGKAEEAINLLGQVDSISEGMPYYQMVINRTYSSIFRRMGDEICIEYENKAISNLLDEPQVDHLELHDIYTFLLDHSLRKGDIKNALQYASSAQEERKYILAEPWMYNSDWQIEYLNIITGDRKQVREKLLSLYKKAGEMDNLLARFDIGYELAIEELNHGNITACKNFLNQCFEIFRIDPLSYGGYNFANEYLNFLYNICSDWNTWNQVFAEIILKADINFPNTNLQYIKLICDQTENCIHSQNAKDFILCIFVLVDRLRLFHKKLNVNNDYAYYSLLYTFTPTIVHSYIWWSFFLKNNKSTITNNQAHQLKSQIEPELASDKIREWLNQLIENRHKYNATNTDILKLANLYIYLDIMEDNFELAQSNLDKLKEWALVNSLNKEFKYETMSTQIDLAILTNNYDLWAKLIDTDAFWTDVRQRNGRIDALSSTMSDLVLYNINNKNYKRAKEIAIKRNSLIREFIDDQFFLLSDGQKDALCDRGILSGYDINCILPHYTDETLLKSAYNASIYFKNILLDSENLFRNAIYASDDSVLTSQYQEYISIRNTIYYNNNRSNQRISSDDLTHCHMLERTLRENVVNSGKLKLNRFTNVGNISSALSSDEVAIEFIAMKDRYGALILRKGESCPRFVELISYKDLEYCIEPLKKSGSNISPKVRRIYSGKSSRGNKLYNYIWVPIEKHLKGIKRIYYSPVGELSTLAIGAIQDTSQVAVCQRFDLRLTSSTANIVKKQNHSGKAWTAMALGDIEYESGENTSHSSSRDWVHLGNSIKEIQHFDSICREHGCDPTLILGSEANEEHFRKYSGNSPSLLLMSTHGFYFDAETASHHNFYINKGLSQLNDSISPNYAIPSMKRGGLVLANANTVWNNDKKVHDEKDGILTADEIAQLDFSGTDLLVLSACQTGLGDLSINEGVHGVQRGFKLAGVDSMILSLWEINDVAAREFMEEFYEKLFNGTERHIAFRDATLKMRDKYPSDPSKWAMFVMLD